MPSRSMASSLARSLTLSRPGLTGGTRKVPCSSRLYHRAYEDLTGRLSTVTKNTTRRARYAYTSGAPGQVQAVIHESFASNAWQATDTGTRVYDGFERLTSIGWTTGTGNNQATVASFAYLYNTANERTRTTLADGSYWQYVYDDLGQVSSGKRYSSTGAPIPGQQFEYTFDDIGNRTQAKAGGDASGNNLRTANYTSNLLNMYTGRGSPGSVDIMGYAPMASYPVSITTGGNTVPADFRLLEYYQKKVSWTNSAAARFEQVLVESDPTHAGSEKELWVFLPKDPEAFTHDVDGNLLQDGRWNYGWDGENRLIWMESRTGLPKAMPRQRVEFGYDFMSRRNVKRMYVPVNVEVTPADMQGAPETVSATTSVIDGATASVAGPGSDAAEETLPAWAVSAPAGWSQVGLSKYIWDGWNLLAELDASNASVRTFAWGLDLSGSGQGAGGIGGLVLGWTRANGSLGGEVTGSGGNTLRYEFDGNGNVMAALDDLGRVRAKYEYGPFGETLTSEGDLAADNPIRWSTKYTDGESGLVYYGYRYYNAGTGRWLNRDPIGERGGTALLSFVKNATSSAIDALGLEPEPPTDTETDEAALPPGPGLQWQLEHKIKLAGR